MSWKTRSASAGWSFASASAICDVADLASAALLRSRMRDKTRSSSSRAAVARKLDRGNAGPGGAPRAFPCLHGSTGGPSRPRRDSASRRRLVPARRAGLEGWPALAARGCVDLDGGALQQLALPIALRGRQGLGQPQVTQRAILRARDRGDDRFGLHGIGGKPFRGDLYPEAGVATGNLEGVFLEQLERPGGVDPGSRCGGIPTGVVVALLQRGLQRRLEHAPGQGSRLLERDRGRQGRHRAVGRFARPHEDELPLLGLPGRDGRPALKPEALGLDQQVGPVGKDPFQQEAALGIRRGRGLARGEKDPRTGDRLTLAIVDQSRPVCGAGEVEAAERSSARCFAVSQSELTGGSPSGRMTIR